MDEQFRKHTVERAYFAIAHGRVERNTIRSRLVADRGDGLRGSTSDPKKGRPAVTHVEPLAYLAEATLIRCRLETGRTHQIRVHLSEAGHPLLGERVYVRHYPNLPESTPGCPAQVAGRLTETWGRDLVGDGVPLVVFTGGEPLLQLDSALALHVAHNASVLSPAPDFADLDGDRSATGSWIRVDDMLDARRVTGVHFATMEPEDRLQTSSSRAARGRK